MLRQVLLLSTHMCKAWICVKAGVAVDDPHVQGLDMC